MIARMIGIVAFICAIAMLFGSRGGSGNDLRLAEQNVKEYRLSQLQKIKVGGLTWEKGGFGTVMIATFSIINDNEFDVKNVTITCGHTSNSGTLIDANSKILYEIVSANGYHFERDFNFGFIDSQANRTRCIVTDFQRA